MKIESVYYELTNLCNLDCRTCYNRSGRHTIREELELDALFASLTQFRRYGLQSVQLSGGETMLYSDILPLFDRIRENQDLPFSVSTNGTVQQDVLLEHYRTIPNLYVQISLDGASEEVNARTRGKDNFAKSMRLLEGLQASDRPVGYRIKMVLSRYNVDDIPAYFHLAAAYHCVPQFAFMSAIGNGKEHWDDMSLSDGEKMKALRYIDEGNKAFHMNVKLPFCAFSCPFTAEPDQLKLSCMVKPSGEIMPCQALYDGEFRLGNIHTFADAELRENMEKLRSLACQRLKIDYGCKKCLIEPICKRGCPAIAVLNSRDILGTDKECSYRLKHYLKYQFRK